MVECERNIQVKRVAGEKLGIRIEEEEEKARQQQQQMMNQQFNP